MWITRLGCGPATEDLARHMRTVRFSLPPRRADLGQQQSARVVRFARSAVFEKWITRAPPAVGHAQRAVAGDLTDDFAALKVIQRGQGPICVERAPLSRRCCFVEQPTSVARD
jgi:hypothetical protein